MAEINKIVEQLSKLTILEVNNLVKKLEETWQINSSLGTKSPQEPKAQILSKEVSEKSHYDLILSSVGDKKISVIKEIKKITGLGLREAKNLSESAPKLIKGSIEKKEAEKLKKQLEQVGAKITLK